jgi:NAD(P)H dehydrogenase (quinone)
MKKLIITAHPSTQGFTHQIADRLRTLSEKNGDTVEILDLYTTDLKQDYLRYEDKRSPRNDPTTQALQEKILWADELIFVSPMWWGDVPAIMKNFIDCNFGSGFAFQYVDGKPI